jgi:hypothetical protein
MTAKKRALLWTPRILGIMFAAFIGIFALDVFDGSSGFWTTAMALLLHLIPTAIILIVVALSWRWEWVGGVLFIAFAALYLIALWGRRLPWSVYLVMSGSLFLVGILFLINWVFRRWIRGDS